MMKLYQEYGTGEVNLFDSWTNSEAFGKLSYTQHLALLALPFEDRAEFAETHQVADMSTRELEQEIREEKAKVEAERDELAKKLTAAQGRAEEAEAAKKVSEETEKKLAEATAKAEAATAKAREAERKLAEIQKKSKMDDPDIAKFQATAEALQQTYNTLNDYRLQVAARNPAAGESLKKFQTALLSQMIDTIQGV
jgi:DNA repair exonuclease SbcCD ATPase subunit